MILIFLVFSVWILLGLQLYVYFGYPFVMMVLARLKKKRKDQFLLTPFEPRVSVIIPARNEEETIGKKLQNSLQLKYPKDKIEIIVVSDNSQDRTEQVVKTFEKDGVRLIVLSEQIGKTGAQNVGVEVSSGEILIFSDANALYTPDAVRHLVNHFQNLEVGCVSGELCYSNTQGTVVGREENFYWEYEKFIKRQEDRVGSILGANGSIYAVRKSDYVPLEQDIISDFIEPLEIAARGKKVVYESKAVSCEEVSLLFEEEFARKRRIVARSIYSLFLHRNLLNPFLNRILAFELISHKILRWLSPFFMVGLLVTSGLLALHGFYRLIFYAQFGFYVMGVLGHLLKSHKRLPTWIFMPYYFCLIGYSSVLGVIDFCRGKQTTFWEPFRS